MCTPTTESTASSERRTPLHFLLSVLCLSESTEARDQGIQHGATRSETAQGEGVSNSWQTPWFEDTTREGLQVAAPGGMSAIYPEACE